MARWTLDPVPDADAGVCVCAPATCARRGGGAPLPVLDVCCMRAALAPFPPGFSARVLLQPSYFAMAFVSLASFWPLWVLVPAR